MFQKYKKYRNKKCLDIDLYVMNIIRNNSKYVKLEVYYTSQKSGIFYYPWPEIDTVKIQNKDFNNWKMIKHE